MGNRLGIPYLGLGIRSGQGIKAGTGLGAGRNGGKAPTPKAADPHPGKPHCPRLSSRLALNYPEAGPA